ncbi:MAG: hypothetical protein WCC48_05060 [Anaeromyxobacteraceae bacterium]
MTSSLLVSSLATFFVLSAIAAPFPAMADERGASSPAKHAPSSTAHPSGDPMEAVPRAGREKAPTDALHFWLHTEAGAGDIRIVLAKPDGTILREWGTAELPDQRTLDDVLSAARVNASPSRSVLIRVRREVKFGTLKRLMIALGPKGPGGFRVWVDPVHEFPLHILGPRL